MLTVRRDNGWYDKQVGAQPRLAASDRCFVCGELVRGVAVEKPRKVYLASHWPSEMSDAEREALAVEEARRTAAASSTRELFVLSTLMDAFFEPQRQQDGKTFTPCRHVGGAHDGIVLHPYCARALAVSLSKDLEAFARAFPGQPLVCPIEDEEELSLY